ncbi:MAG: ABC transporter permease [Acidobacteriia bacterium]|nr:ABC transporter permease [Terriglobia bacterium]
MPWLHRLKHRINRLTRRRQLDRDLEDELQFHLDMLAQDHPHPRRRFGNVTSMKEACRELWMFGSLEIWWQDLRYALRMLRKSPAFTTVAVLTLALAIGANTAIFSVVNGVMLRELPYRDAGRLAMLWSTAKDHADERRTSIPNFADWKSQSRSFESMAFYASEGATLIDPADRLEPETITYGDVAADFFGVLGVSPMLGRSLSEQDVTQGERVVVLSHDLWLKRYGGSPKALGERLDLNGKEYRVVGVMPGDFHFPSNNVQLWAPATTSEWLHEHSAQRGRGTVVVFGRLKPQYSVAQAQAEMATISSRLERQYRETNDGLTVRVVPLQTQVLGRTVPFLLLVLFGAVFFVLLIACTNVANLLLARGAARQREFALRAALGAGRMRILRQMVTESTVLALCGGAIGLVLAGWGVHLLAVFGPRNIPRLDEIHVDARVVIFTLAVSVLSGVLFGLMPEWRDQAFRPGSTLKNTGRNAHATGNGLVIAEFALAVVLLTGAGLLIRSFQAVRAVDPGFQAQHVVTMELNSRWSDDFHEQVMSRIRTIPGVQFVGAINDIFFARGGKSLGVDTLDEVEGHAPEPRDRWRPLVITPLERRRLPGSRHAPAEGAPLLRSRWRARSAGSDRQRGHGAALLAGRGSGRKAIQGVPRK